MNQATQAAIDALKGLVEAFYSQTPELPKTSIQFKMRMNHAIDFLKESGVELPKYEAFRAKRLAEMAQKAEGK